MRTIKAGISEIRNQNEFHFEIILDLVAIDFRFNSSALSVPPVLSPWDSQGEAVALQKNCWIAKFARLIRHLPILGKSSNDSSRICLPNGHKPFGDRTFELEQVQAPKLKSPIKLARILASFRNVFKQHG